jgi:hypothetical protein
LTLGENVASGLVLRFSTIDCVNDNLDCFEDGFGDSGSFLDVSDHRFYVTVTKLFLEEVIDVADPLYDAGSSCSESSDLGAMVEVLALGDEEGGDSPRTARPPLECLLPQEQATPLPKQDTPDVVVVDLLAQLDHAINPIQAAKGSGRASHSSAKRPMMSMHASILVDSVGPPSAEVCRTTTSFP